MQVRSVKEKFNPTGKSIAQRQSLSFAHENILVFTLPSHLNTSVYDKKKITENVVIDEIVYPFLSLSIKNQAELFKIGKSFINDIEKGHTQFGFASMSKEPSEKHLLAYGSFINFKLRRPVLIVVKDLQDKAWDTHRGHFTYGTLGKWKCLDWGNLCFVDYAQMTDNGESFNCLNLKEVTSEFAAIVWSLPGDNLNKFMPRNAFCLLEKINSITMVIGKGKTSSRELLSIVKSYQAYGITVKGILTNVVVR